MYDKIVEKQFGMIYGNSTAVYIKTGRGGDIYGYDNKYLNITNMLYDHYGYTCVVSANPADSKGHDFCGRSDENDISGSGCK